MSENLHRIMYGLLFPAVLGTVFVSFIAEDLKNIQLSPRMLFGAVFLFHWVVEFSISTKPGKEATYRPYEFVSDLLIIIAMYSAFYSLPAVHSLGFILTNFYLSVMAIGIIFTGTNLIRNRLTGELKLKLTVIDVLLALWGALFAALSFHVSSFNSANSAYIFILGVLSASLTAIFYAGSRERG